MLSNRSDAFGCTQSNRPHVVTLPVGLLYVIRMTASICGIGLCSKDKYGRIMENL